MIRFTFTTAQRYLPMRFLLDDDDLRSVPLAPDMFRIMRRSRRRIYLGYVRDFRRESGQLLRLRLRHIAARGHWQSLAGLAVDALRHLGIVAGFYAAWAGHGLRLPPAKRVARNMLRKLEAGLGNGGFRVS